MAEPQYWRGSWSIAVEPETVRQGVLHRDEEDRFRLELVGGFDIEVREPLPDGRGWAVKSESRTVEMIHGTAEGHLFTVLVPQAIHTTGFIENITAQSWSSNRVLKGIHLARLDEPVFTRAHLQLNYLLQWSNRTTLSLIIPMQDGKQGGELEVHRQPEIVMTAQHEQMQCGLRIRSHEFNVERRPAAGTTTIQTTEWAVLDIDPPSALPYDAFDTINRDLQDLLTFCAYVPAASQDQSLMYNASAAHLGHTEFPNEVKVMGRQIYCGTPPVPETPFHNYLFTLDALDFSELIPRWLGLKEKARLGCNILFGLRYISEGYVGNRLLGIATAAESIHRALRPTKTPLTPQQFKTLKQKLRDAIMDDPDDNVRAFVNNGLHNNPTYRERLLDLADIPQSAVVDKLLTDRERWAMMLKRSRNDLAHANERSTANADTSAAFWLLEITYALLHLVLMAELGLDGEAQRRALEHPKISWARTQFQNVLDGSMSE